MRYGLCAEYRQTGSKGRSGQRPTGFQWWNRRSKVATPYRYWDATAFAEYLFGQVAEAIRHDLREEIDFLNMFDEAVRKTVAIVDIPDRRASLLARLIIQNKGTLAKGKRALFSELTDEEIGAIERAVDSSGAQ